MSFFCCLVGCSGFFFPVSLFLQKLLDLKAEGVDRCQEVKSSRQAMFIDFKHF